MQKNRSQNMTKDKKDNSITPVSTSLKGKKKLKEKRITSLKFELILAIIIALEFTYLGLPFLIKYRNHLPAILFASLLFVLIFIIISKKAKLYLNRDDVQKNIRVLSWLSILFAGLSFFFTIITDIAQERQTLKDIEQSLIIASQLNRDQAQSILADKDQEWLYWDEFSLISYQPNLNYIMSYKSKECQIRYLESINAMEVVNNANRALLSLGTEKVLIFTSVQLDAYDGQFDNLKSLIQKNASSTYDSIDYILKNCMTSW
jgi:hypothetical protein